jgi:hypothetical protein
MKNAGYTKEETAEWLKLTGAGIAPEINVKESNPDDRRKGGTSKTGE